MRKPVLARCEQERCWSACASAQSDQHLSCSLPGYYNVSSFYTGNFKPPPSFCSWTGRIESTLFDAQRNPKDRFSRDKAQIIQYLVCIIINRPPNWELHFYYFQFKEESLRKGWPSFINGMYMLIIVTCSTTKPIKWSVHPANTLISLGICSECSWRSLMGP